MAMTMAMTVTVVAIAGDMTVSQVEAEMTMMGVTILKSPQNLGQVAGNLFQRGCKKPTKKRVHNYRKR
jgi:hypothetical protein